MRRQKVKAVEFKQYLWEDGQRKHSHSYHHIVVVVVLYIPMNSIYYTRSIKYGELASTI